MCSTKYWYTKNIHVNIIQFVKYINETNKGTEGTTEPIIMETGIRLLLSNLVMNHIIQQVKKKWHGTIQNNTTPQKQLHTFSTVAKELKIWFNYNRIIEQIMTIIINSLIQLYKLIINSNKDV